MYFVCKRSFDADFAGSLEKSPVRFLPGFLCARRFDIEVKMNISGKIFELIKEKGMTQKEFGRRTGIPQSTISDWKSKQLNPASDKILIICDVLEVSPYELLGAAQGGSRYAIPDHVIVQKDTEEYLLIERYRQLKKDQRERLLGYMEAIRNL